MRFFPRQKTLSIYLIRQNLFLLTTCLGCGTGLYLLIDVFERLDKFIAAGAGWKITLWHFIIKTPLIISQILPAVFLISMVSQLSLMARHRELLALRSAGISLEALARIFIPYALVWCMIQLVFSQGPGVYGTQEATRIWRQYVTQHVTTNEQTYTNVWLREKNFIINMQSCVPGQGSVGEVTVFEMTQDRQHISRILHANSAKAVPGNWVFFQVRETRTQNYAHSFYEQYNIPLEYDLKAYVHMDLGDDPVMSFPLWDLGEAIQRLQEAGSNVERLRTAWHMKWSYSFSLLTMALLALVLLTLSENIYYNIASSLVATFLYYVLFLLGATLGQKGILSPILAAWLANVFFCSACSLWLFSIKR